MNPQPRVSIVTPSYNQGAFIAQTIESVLAQDYANLEYIIIDGGSTDNTLEVIRQYESDSRLFWMSEPDNGQAHAINKGFARAAGDIMGWLNSDDTFIGQPAHEAVDYFQQNPLADLLYRNAIFVQADGTPTGDPPLGAPLNLVDVLSDVSSIPQPGTFWRRSLWTRTGALREDLLYAMDTDFWLRASRCGELHFLPGVRSAYRLHGESKTVTQSISMWQEDAKLAAGIFMQPEAYPDLYAKRRLIESNLAWGLARAYHQQHDRANARQHVRRALAKSPPRLRWFAMLALAVDLHLGTNFSDPLSTAWCIMKKAFHPFK